MKLIGYLAVLGVTFLLAVHVHGDKDEEFIKVVISPSGKDLNSKSSPLPTHLSKHHRTVRTPHTCRLPESSNDAQLECKFYPKRVSCTQTCIFGHTLTEGIQREMECIHEENRWTPVPHFERCRPFVDCTMTISYGGESKCIFNNLLSGPLCELSCDHFEDKPAVPRAIYQCNITGEWSPKLPHCAKAGSGIQLVPPPIGPKVILEN